MPSANSWFGILPFKTGVRIERPALGVAVWLLWVQGAVRDRPQFELHIQGARRGLWALALPTGLAFLALVIGLATKLEERP